MRATACLALGGIMGASGCAWLLAVEQVEYDDAGRRGSDAEDVFDVAEASDGGLWPCQHSFCDDFDHAALGALWDHAYEGSGTLALTTEFRSSPPYSLKASLPIIDASVGMPSCLAKEMVRLPQGRATRAFAQVQMRIDQAGLALGTNLFGIEANPPPPGYAAMGWFLQKSGGSFVFQEFRELSNGDSSGSSSKVVNLTFAGFTRISMDVDLSGAPFRARLFADGALITTLSTPPVPLDASTGFGMFVGFEWAEDVRSPWTVEYDDVFLDVFN
jgi:hypothetical protein